MDARIRKTILKAGLQFLLYPNQYLSGIHACAVILTLLLCMQDKAPTPLTDLIINIATTNLGTTFAIPSRLRNNTSIINIAGIEFDRAIALSIFATRTLIAAIEPLAND